jgi:hypothetical protein
MRWFDLRLPSSVHFFNWILDVERWTFSACLSVLRPLSAVFCLSTSMAFAVIH